MKINLFFATTFCRGSACLGQTIEHKKYPSNGGESQRTTRDYTTWTFFYLKPKTSLATKLKYQNLSPGDDDDDDDDDNEDDDAEQGMWYQKWEEIKLFFVQTCNDEHM